MSVSTSLNKFGKDVVKQSKSELSRRKKSSTKSLYNSKKYEFKEEKKSYSISFFMEDYGKFVDKGVKGVGGRKADGSQWKKKRVLNSSFKYRDKRPPAFAFNGWTIRKGLAPRDSAGRFTSRKSLMFAIAEIVYRTGIETTNFFTTPLEREFKKLPDQVINSYSLEIDDMLEFALK